MLSESYIKSRMKILRYWVIKNTNLKGQQVNRLAEHIFNKYYGKCQLC